MNEAQETKQERINLMCPVCGDAAEPITHLLRRMEKTVYDDTRTNEQISDYEFEFTGYCLPCCEELFADNLSEEELEKIHNGTMTQEYFDKLFEG